MKIFSKSLTLAAAIALSSSAFAGLHSEDDGAPKGKAGDGSCTYMLQNNMMDSQVKTCEQPANAAGCKVLGSIDDNSDSKHAKGDCSMEGAKGSCDTGEVKWVYYDGDWESMETGCGFQGGDWTDY
ncbi:hypothetical protein [Oceanicoccus sp. KOV_DT_Chl]|uniref:hypothetical protein n=1 Tax=Oceanicoccus sp. KOV_DT_Chl TaxID=1904639 RepID=UPI000C79CAE4|nr:hypothetical protein [Oceanicoccus sp. KOV_DT_Chl]